MDSSAPFPMLLGFLWLPCKQKSQGGNAGTVPIRGSLAVTLDAVQGPPDDQHHVSQGRQPEDVALLA